MEVNMTFPLGKFLKLLAEFQLGDVAGDRRVLDSMSSSDPFDENLAELSMDGLISDITIARRFHNPYSVVDALSACCYAQDWKRGYGIIEKINCLVPSFFDPKESMEGENPWIRLTFAGLILEHCGQLKEVFSYLLQASEIISKQRDQTVDFNMRRMSFATPVVTDIFAGPARVCVRASQGGIPLSILNTYPHKHPHAKTWIEHSVLSLEQAKSRTLLDALVSCKSDSSVIRER